MNLVRLKKTISSVFKFNYPPIKEYNFVYKNFLILVCMSIVYLSSIRKNKYNVKINFISSRRQICFSPLIIAKFISPIFYCSFKLPQAYPCQFFHFLFLQNKVLFIIKYYNDFFCFVNPFFIFCKSANCQISYINDTP